MTNLNLRNFPPELLNTLKQQALRSGMTLRAYSIMRLEGRMVQIVASDALLPAPRAQARQSQPAADESLDYTDCQDDGALPADEKRKRLAETMARFKGKITHGFGS